MEHKLLLVWILITVLLYGAVMYFRLCTVMSTPYKPAPYKLKSQPSKPAPHKSARPKSGPPPRNEPSRLFLYLVQTESCLPDNLMSIEVIGDTRTCQCDVLILSYKEVCNFTPPVHMKYIFNSSTSWGSGRNFLYEETKRRSVKYLYYIFMDDDINLVTTVTTTRNVSVTKKNSWRIFEDFLQRIQPAIGAVDPTNNRLLKDTYAGRNKQGCSLNGLVEYLPSARYDPAFNAFHYQAIEYLLPYPCTYDNISWYFAELQVEIKCEMIFAGQSVVHTGLLAQNPNHRPYTRKLPTVNDWDYLVNDVLYDLPEKYQHSTLLMEWKRDGIKHGEKSSTVCLSPPPPKMPIKPFVHLDQLTMYT